AEGSPAICADHFASLKPYRRHDHQDRANDLRPPPAPPNPKTPLSRYKFCAAFSRSVLTAFAHLERPETKRRDAALNIQRPLLLHSNRAKYSLRPNPPAKAKVALQNLMV